MYTATGTNRKAITMPRDSRAIARPRAHAHERSPRWRRDVSHMNAMTAAEHKRPHRLAEEHLGDHGSEEHDERPGDRGGEPPPPGVHPEGLDPQRDLPFPERRMHPRTDVPLLRAPVLLVAGVHMADLVRPPDEDA